MTSRDTTASGFTSTTPPTDPRHGSARRLRRAAWWCLAAFPLLFVLVWFVGLIVFPDGRWVSDGSLLESSTLAFDYVVLVIPPMATLVLSSMAFRRTRAWRDLAPALTLCGVIVAGLALFYVQPGVRSSPELPLWNLAIPAGIAAWLVAVIAWPSRS